MTQPDALARSAAHIRRALADLGTGSLGDHDDARTHASPGSWTLDPIPRTFAEAEWARISRALEQRAMVLDLILDDLFGAQRLLAAGHLPTGAILAHPEYLRQCVGVASPGGHRLVLYACDLARTTAGEFTVLSDRTQMPSGVDTAVQNREVMARVTPEALQEHDVHPIEQWLSVCRSALGALTPPGVELPRIVMMRPPASNGGSAAHAYLARTLGFALVEPSDLTVRDACVWLKSVAGLEPVHVVVRLVESRHCDPLELDAEPLLGVAGLVEACRRNNVALANPLGSGVGECAALLPFMARLTRTLLGEDPLMDSAPTWWCGEPAGRSHVLSNMDSLLIRSQQPVDGRHTLFGRLMSSSERAELADRIAAAPHEYTGQEETAIEEAPSFSGGAVVERPTVTRTFLVRDNGGYRCMQGGLTLTADRAEDITFASYGVSKDTWVTNGTVGLNGGSSRSRSKAREPLAPIDLRSSITSRAAESMFWIGRNLERCHAVIRLVRAVSLLNETRHDLRDADDSSWGWTVDRLVGTVAGPAWSMDPAPPPSTTADLLVDALTDRSRPRSLTTSLHFLLQNASAVRELFSADSWRLLGQVSENFACLTYAAPGNAAEIGYASVTPLLALSSLINDSMVRDPGWRFLDIGRRIESASLMAMTLRSALTDELSGALASPFLESLLSTWDGLGAYRRRYRSDVDPALLIDLLVTDGSNPRSIRSQLAALADDFDDIPGPPSRSAEILGAVRALTSTVSSANPDSLATVDGTGRPELDQLTTSIVSALDSIATEIDLTFFVHARATNMFADLLGSGAP